MYRTTILLKTRFAAFICVALLQSYAALAVPVGPVIGEVALILGTVTGIDQDGDTF